MIYDDPSNFLYHASSRILTAFFAVTQALRAYVIPCFSSLFTHTLTYYDYINNYHMDLRDLQIFMSCLHSKNFRNQIRQT